MTRNQLVVEKLSIGCKECGQNLAIVNEEVWCLDCEAGQLFENLAGAARGGLII